MAARNGMQNRHRAAADAPTMPPQASDGCRTIIAIAAALAAKKGRNIRASRCPSLPPGTIDLMRKAAPVLTGSSASMTSWKRTAGSSERSATAFGCWST
jgi:hypothetical protein